MQTLSLQSRTRLSQSFLFSPFLRFLKWDEKPYRFLKPGKDNWVSFCLEYKGEGFTNYYSYEVWFSCKDRFIYAVQVQGNIINRLKWDALESQKGMLLILGHQVPKRVIQANWEAWAPCVKWNICFIKSSSEDLTKTIIARDNEILELSTTEDIPRSVHSL